MKFFRPLRENSTNSYSYFKYATGEIILVAVGILIALQVNNWNESRIEEKAMNDYFQKIASNVQEDVKESKRLLKFRQEHIAVCNDVSKALIENDFSSFANLGLDMDVLYNIADAINKIGFGLVIYSLARHERPFDGKSATLPPKIIANRHSRLALYQVCIRIGRMV